MMKSRSKDGHKSEMTETYLQCALKVMFSFTQMPAKRGIQKFGMRAIAAMMKELRQLSVGAVPGKPVVIPIDPNTLTKKDLEEALDAVNLIKEKGNGDLKGRTCANGSKQRRFVKEGDNFASPTVSVEALFTTLIIAAHEEREIISFDVPGAFLQADMPDDKLMLLRLTGEFVDLMCEINPDFIPHVRLDRKGRKILYMRVIRAIYGCIEAALQWYKLFKSTLEGKGFILNPYDLCVANKVIEGKQCTIAWYADDCIATHASKDVLKFLSDDMQKHFGKMDIVTGSDHDFLGMKIKIKDKRIEIDMSKQLKEVIDVFEACGEIAPGGVTSCAAHHLFEVRKDAEQLNEEKSEVFHSLTAKLLYIMKRARPDLETAISFLSRQVSKSDMDD